MFEVVLRVKLSDKVILSLYGLKVVFVFGSEVFNAIVGKALGLINVAVLFFYRVKMSVVSSDCFNSPTQILISGINKRSSYINRLTIVVLI